MFKLLLRLLGHSAGGDPLEGFVLLAGGHSKLRAVEAALHVQGKRAAGLLVGLGKADSVDTELGVLAGAELELRHLNGPLLAINISRAHINSLGVSKTGVFVLAAVEHVEGLGGEGNAVPLDEEAVAALDNIPDDRSRHGANLREERQPDNTNLAAHSSRERRKQGKQQEGRKGKGASQRFTSSVSDTV